MDLLTQSTNETYIFGIYHACNSLQCGSAYKVYKLNCVPCTCNLFGQMNVRIITDIFPILPPLSFVCLRPGILSHYGQLGIVQRKGLTE